MTTSMVSMQGDVLVSIHLMSHTTEAKKKWEKKASGRVKCPSVPGLTQINCIPQNLVCYLKKQQKTKPFKKVQIHK